MRRGDRGIAVMASVGLVGCPSCRSAIPGATGCPRGGHRLSHEPGRTRCLATLPPPERCKGRHSPSIDRLCWAENRSLRSVFTLLRIEGRPVSAAAKNSAGPCPAGLLACEVQQPYIAPCLTPALSPPLGCRDASGDESPDASLHSAGAAIGAVARHRRGYGRRLMALCGHPIHNQQRPQPHSPWLAAATRSTT